MDLRVREVAGQNIASGVYPTFFFLTSANLSWFPDGATSVHVILTTISHKSVASSPVQNTTPLHSPKDIVLRKSIFDLRVNKMPQSAERDGKCMGFLFLFFFPSFDLNFPLNRS